MLRNILRSGSTNGPLRRYPSLTQKMFRQNMMMKHPVAQQWQRSLSLMPSINVQKSSNFKSLSGEIEGIQRPYSAAKSIRQFSSSGGNLGNIFQHAQNATKKSKPGETLEQFGVDLTQMANEGKLDPVIGRHEEIRRTLQILARRTKNNPVLIGEPGVGEFSYNL